MTHQNSLFAHRQVDHSKRRGEVCDWLRRWGKPATDRQIASGLGSADMNYARPSITGLINDGVLSEVDDVICPVTGRRVRRTWFAGEVE